MERQQPTWRASLFSNGLEGEEEKLGPQELLSDDYPAMQIFRTTALFEISTAGGRRGRPVSEWSRKSPNFYTKLKVSLYAVHMPSRFYLFARIATIAMLLFASSWTHAEQAETKAVTGGSLVIEGLGKGVASLNGPWSFHLGDDPSWAKPSFDSSSWEQISAERPWGEQGYALYTGYAWYRCRVSISPAPGVAPQFSLLTSQIDDAYEVYWNGSLVGHNGKLEPRPIWYYTQPAQVFPLGQVQSGILAIRVWKAPLLSDDSGRGGGFESAPMLGSPRAISDARDAMEFHWLRSRQFLFGQNLLCALAGLLSFLLWLRSPGRSPLFWMTGFALIPPVNLLLLNAHVRWPYTLVMAVVQPLAAVRDLSLWFLLLWLFPLHSNRTITRLTRVLACIYLANGVIDGVLIAFSWNAQWIGLIRVLDGGSAFLFSILQVFPIILVGHAFFQRKSLNSVRWLVAISAFLNEMIIVVRNIAKQGRQFTDWPFASKIDSPLFSIGGCSVSLYTLSGILLLAAIIYAVYHSIEEDRRLQESLEREKMELMRESERMRHYAEHDGLTGLWNHRIIVERLQEEMDRSRRYGVTLSVVLIDIDHFKKINDSFGHPTGDLVLRELSVIFTQSLLSYDCVGRYGGEEFLVILPNCEMETALARAEKLRIAVASAHIQDGEEVFHITASFGVASVLPSADAVEAETVIRSVDTALYKAKNNGRNCVMPAEMDMPLCES